MYEAHFGLHEAPFGITPDTGFFFACRSAQEALNTLLIAVKGGEGFLKITGEVGTGKTMLCRKFMATLDAHFVTAYIPNPYLEPRTLMLALADELGAAVSRRADQHQVLKAITYRLVELARDCKHVVLCVDEAQAMPVETLEAIRLLSNLETEKRKLLQIVLFGQPELDRTLQRKSVRQLAQRITFHYRLAPLSQDDIDFYLAHRLRIAGYAGSRLFERDAVSALRRASGGIPRLVNVVAHKALMLAYGEGRAQIQARHIRMAARDTLAARTPYWKMIWIGLASLLMAAGGAAWAFLR